MRPIVNSLFVGKVLDFVEQKKKSLFFGLN